MSKPTVLIVGAGIAGPICAFWLSRAGIPTTVIERAPELRKAGQQIDIRGNAVKAIERVSLEDVIRAKTTKESGLNFVNSSGRIQASFPVDGNGFTSDFEIIRGELNQIFYDASEKDTEGRMFRFLKVFDPAPETFIFKSCIPKQHKVVFCTPFFLTNS